MPDPRPAVPRAAVARTGRRPPSLPGILAVATAALIAVLVTFGIFLPAIGAIGRAITGNAATLPARVSVCGQEWQRDPLARQLTREEIYERTEAEPIVVSSAPLAACPLDAVAGGSPVSTVYVQLGDGAFVAYDLVATH